MPGGEIMTRAMLVSLGGSPAPVIFSINHQRPEYLVFFVSPQSEADVETVLKAVNYPFKESSRIITGSAELLADCYAAIRDGLPAALDHWKLTYQDLTVDYTGGTKSMSAAMVLATATKVHRYSYVGGEERNKGGVGVVIDGRERMWFLQNPLWEAFL
jgi:hypothetical protein